MVTSKSEQPKERDELLGLLRFSDPETTSVVQILDSQAGINSVKAAIHWGNLRQSTTCSTGFVFVRRHTRLQMTVDIAALEIN